MANIHSLFSPPREEYTSLYHWLWAWPWPLALANENLLDMMQAEAGMCLHSWAYTLELLEKDMAWVARMPKEDGYLDPTDSLKQGPAEISLDHLTPRYRC